MSHTSLISRRSVLTATAVTLAAPALLAQQKFTMKMGTPGVDDVGVAWMRAVKAGVESRSNGRIKVEIYPATSWARCRAWWRALRLARWNSHCPPRAS